MLRYGSRRMLSRVPSEAPSGGGAVRGVREEEPGMLAPEDTPPSPLTPGVTAGMYEIIAERRGNHNPGGVESYEQAVRAPELMRLRAQPSKQARLEAYYPPHEGFRTTEDYYYAWMEYPDDVKRAKEELLHRTSGVPKSGIINPLGPEHNNALEKASQNLTREGVFKLEEKYLHAINHEGLSRGEAVRAVLAGEAGDPEVSQHNYQKAMELERMQSDPYYKAGDDNLREVAAEGTKAAALFQDEGLVLDASQTGAKGVAARRELMKKNMSVESVVANPLRFFLHSSAAMRSRRQRKQHEATRQKTQFATRASWLEAEKEKERKRVEYAEKRRAQALEDEKELAEMSVSDADIDDIFGDDDDAAGRKAPAGAPAAGADAGQPPQQQQQQQQQAKGEAPAVLKPTMRLATRDPAAAPSTVPTPEDLKAHTVRLDATIRERKEALRLKNISELTTPKPLSSVIPGGSYSENRVLATMMKDFMRANDPDIERKLWPERFWEQPGRGGKPKAPQVSDELKDAASKSFDATTGLDPFSHDTHVLRALMERSLQTMSAAIEDNFVKFYEGSAELAISQMSRLTAELDSWTQHDLAGPGAALPDMHAWHVHCVRLLCHVRLDRQVYHLASNTRDQTKARMRMSVLQHNEQKLEKLTASLGRKFYDDFWAAAKSDAEDAKERQVRLDQRLLGSSNQMVAMSLALQKDHVVSTLRDDYTRFLSEVCRVAREFDAGKNWAVLDAYLAPFIAKEISLSHEKRHYDLRSQFIADPRPLIDSFIDFARSIVMFNWSGATMRRAQFTLAEELLSRAAQQRQESVARIAPSLEGLQRYGVLMESPMRQDYYVVADAEGLDGSEKEARGNMDGAKALYEDRHRRGLIGDIRDIVAYHVRNHDLHAADERMVIMMRMLEGSPGAAIARWDTRSKAHRVALWHRYMADLNMWLARLWAGYRCYPRAKLIANHALSNAQYHFAEADRIHLLPTEQTVADQCTTAAIDAHLHHNAIFQDRCESAETFGFTAELPEEVDGDLLSLEGLARKQDAALALFSEVDGAAVDDDPWVGYGTGVRWFIIVSCDQVQREVNVSTGYATDGSSGDIDAWYSGYRRLEALLSECDEGCERAYVSGRMALHLVLRPCYSVAERNIVMDDAAEKAQAYVQWLSVKASRRVVLDQRGLWMNIVALAFWARFRQGRAARKTLPRMLDSLLTNRGRHMRYFDVGTLSNAKSWVEDYNLEPADDAKWLSSVLVGTGRLYLSQPELSYKQRVDFEEEHYPDGAAAAVSAASA